ncbi:MAG: ABC transporter substrate-binding protein [Chloroflexi bacterium]|nr:ABC transporter substrate-binding protein [Chloroflexota bacterium]
MGHRTARLGAGLVSTAALVLASAGLVTAQSAADATEAPVCDAVPVGIVTRCENFYTDYWPAVNAALDQLHQEALATNGGQVVIWDWYELSPDVINAFTTRFPGLTIKTQGFQQNLSSSIITAQQTGTENTDYLSGSLTSATPLYDSGLFEQVDWTQYGIPAEWLTVGPAELLPDSLNSWLLNYNTSKVTEVPSALTDFLDASFKDQLAMASWNGQFFTGYGMANGKDAMQQLIADLKGGNLTLTDNPGDLLSTGDKPITFAGQLFNPNPDLAVAPITDGGVWIQFGGVNAEGKNKPGATLYAIWNAYDPDWITARLTTEDLNTSAVPFPGLPTDVLGQATGLAKVNADAMYEQATIGQWETQDTRDQWNEMISAADEIMYQ